jgi:hypothetical protein
MTTARIHTVHTHSTGLKVNTGRWGKRGLLCKPFKRLSRGHSQSEPPTMAATDTQREKHKSRLGAGDSTGCDAIFGY